jgi:hypothetical protein
MKFKIKFLICLPILAFSLNVPKDFIEGYKIGKEFGKKEVVLHLQNIKQVLKIQREIFKGNFPACYIDRFGELKLLKPINLSVYTPHLRNGYYVIFDLSDYPDYFKGYVVYKLRQMNYSPDFDRNKVWIRFDSKADAEEFLKETEKKLKIEGYIILRN